MSAMLNCRLKAYIQPFERELAYRELEALTNSTLKDRRLNRGSRTLWLRSDACADILARELAFWEVVSNGEPLITKQSLRESTVNGVRNYPSLDVVFKELPFQKEISLPNRRCLRYGPHGVHEYRGKFFPQLVRAFINIGGVPKGGIVADPFSGSGTTAIEAILADRIAIGLDMNPLSVFMGQTKCDILTVKLNDLESCYKTVRRSLQDSRRRFDLGISKLSAEDQEYLNLWFHPAILKDLDQIAGCIFSLTNIPVRNFMLLCLSNILRRVSWQKEADLRVRRELKPAGDIDPLKEFLDELGRSTELMLAFLHQESRPLGRTADIKQGDSKDLANQWKGLLGKVDAIITSPPYATALPYLDTDRLSLSFLGLLNRSEHRNRDREMIGNREITDKARRILWEEFCFQKNLLPSSVSNLVMQIFELNEDSNIGFRRRNLPALLFKYFRDMSVVFAGMAQLLKAQARAFVVVGNNHTIAGGERVNINTVELLRDLAEVNGFETVEQIDMEMLISRDIFRKNAIDSESILHFRNRG